MQCIENRKILTNKTLSVKKIHLSLHNKASLLRKLQNLYMMIQNKNWKLRELP
jgi:hypothetical protein